MHPSHHRHRFFQEVFASHIFASVCLSSDSRILSSASACLQFFQVVTASAKFFGLSILTACWCVKIFTSFTSLQFFLMLSQLRFFSCLNWVFLQDLAVLADFDHIIPQVNKKSTFIPTKIITLNSTNIYQPDNMEYGDILFKKEFYASAICDQENGTNMRLRKFARAWLAVSGDDEDDSRDISVTCRETPVDWDLEF